MKKLHKKALVFLLFGILSASTVFGQSKPYPISDESVYVHSNTSLFFVGEYIYYKFYVLNKETSSPSTISKIGYVELVSESGETIFNQKLFLTNGSGQGDYFIPVDIPSGNYKIIAYTKNMLAQETPHIYHQDVSILNPYQGDQEKIVKDGVASPSLKNNSRVMVKMSGGISLHTDNTVYGKRQPVTLKLQSNKTRPEGSFSVSVRRLSSFPKPIRTQATTFESANSSTISISNDNLLPELRGELMSGSLVMENPAISKEDVKIALSFPGSENLFSISSVTSEGVFYFTIDDPYTSSQAILEVLEYPSAEVKTEMSSKIEIDLTNLSFFQFSISEEMKSEIISRSVHNQIENAYYQAKPDTIRTLAQYQSTFQGTSERFVLDEYTRFKTMEETMVEIVNDAWVGKSDDGARMLVAETVEDGLRSNNPSLLIVDGIYVSDHERILNYDATRIESIRVIKDQYFFGPSIFQGVFIIDTFKDDFANRYTETASTIELFPPAPTKNYYVQDYSVDTSKNHLPDYRYQLYWNPNYNVKDDSEIRFFTSDVTGTYAISVEGFQQDGTPVSLISYIEIE